MPKESINSIDTSGTRAVVAWRSAPEGHVQVVTINPKQPEQHEVDGWYVTLDREQVNRMIRCLRRARDSAFGADA